MCVTCSQYARDVYSSLSYSVYRRGLEAITFTAPPNIQPRYRYAKSLSPCPTRVAAPTPRAGHRLSNHVGTDSARQLTEQCWPCICRRLQEMEKVRAAGPDSVVGNGSWRGRLPNFAHERWFLVTHPEKHNGYNIWYVHHSWQNGSMSSQPQWWCKWWGVWHMRDGPQVTDFLEIKRNAPWCSGDSSYVVAAIRVGLRLLSPACTKPQ